jgi:hypothetical protein
MKPVARKRQNGRCESSHNNNNIKYKRATPANQMSATPSPDQMHAVYKRHTSDSRRKQVESKMMRKLY